MVGYDGLCGSIRGETTLETRRRACLKCLRGSETGRGAAATQMMTKNIKMWQEMVGCWRIYDRVEMCK